MKVLINALGAHMGGALRHLQSFIPALIEVDPETKYTVLVRRAIPHLSEGANVYIKHIDNDIASSVVSRLNFDLWKLPRQLRREGFDLTVSLTNFGPIWCGIPHISFQRNALYFASGYEGLGGVGRRTSNWLRRRLVIESIKRARVVVTPSHAMGEMIQQRLPQLRGHDLRVIYHGFSASSMQEPLSNNLIESLGKGKIRLFYPSHLAPHKGFSILFSAIHILRKRGLDVTLFAPLNHADHPREFGRLAGELKTLAIEHNVVFLGDIAQQQMGALYRNCDLVVYPSLVESFGFGMLEAMAFKIPIVAAGTPVNREICRDAALYYSPLDGSDCANAIDRALCADQHKELVLACDKRMSSFDWSWNRYARDFSDLVHDSGLR